MPMLNLPPVEEEKSAEMNAYPAFYWNHAGLEMNRITHSLGGPQGGPPMSSRALGLLHLAMHDAFFGALGKAGTASPKPYLPDMTVAWLSAEVVNQSGGSPVDTGNLDNANAALTGAAITILDRLYAGDHPNISIVASETLTDGLNDLVKAYAPHINILSPAHQFGVVIADAIHKLLGVGPGEPGADAGRYEPKQGPYFFRDEPVVPIRKAFIDPNNEARGTRIVREYHGPLYGTTVSEFAVHHPDAHTIAHWPKPESGLDQKKEYDAALKEVVRLGGAGGLPSTKRTADQSVIGPDR